MITSMILFAKQKKKYMITRRQIENIIVKLLAGDNGAKQDYIWMYRSNNSTIFQLCLGLYTTTQYEIIEIDIADPKSIDHIMGHIMGHIDIFGDITTVNVKYEKYHDEHGDQTPDYHETSEHINSIEASVVNKGFQYGSDVYFYPGKLHKGQEIFIVTAVYSDGDTFGRHTGYTELTGVYASEEKAKEAKRLLEENNKSNEYPAKQGEYVHIPWSGYFASLDEFRIDKVALK